MLRDRIVFRACESGNMYSFPLDPMRHALPSPLHRMSSRCSCVKESRTRVQAIACGASTYGFDWLCCYAISTRSQVNVPALQKIMHEFARENEKSELTGELIGDTLDDAMADDGDAEAEEKIVGQASGSSHPAISRLALLVSAVR